MSISQELKNAKFTMYSALLDAHQSSTNLQNIMYIDTLFFK